MWTSYSTKDTAEVVGLSQSTVRNCAREGLLEASPDALPLRFSFQDLRVLKTLKGLTLRGVSIRRARRQLAELRARRGGSESLASLRIEAHNGHVVVRDGERLLWHAESGQLIFDFQFDEQPGDVAAIPTCAERALNVPELMANLTADEWFEQALASEEENPQRAMAAYRQVLKQRPACTESLINLGRLLAEAGDVERATQCFQDALEVDPREATALYNLGVIAQDSGSDLAAIEHYEAALSIDRELAEAHYNLATIFDKTGDARAAIRHINEFRKLSRRRH